VSDWESIQADAEFDMAYEQTGHKEAVEKIEDDILNDEELIKDRHEEIVHEKNCRNIISNYQIEDYYHKNQDWKMLTTEDKIDYCSSLLQPIELDDMPLQRQVFVLTNLVNLNLEVLDYYEILECAFYDSTKVDTVTMKINYLIPQKHYVTYLKKLYNASAVKTLSIPEDNTTEYLQELFMIWCKHKNDVSNYAIARDITPCNPSITQYEEKQIIRKITAIKKLIR